MNAIALPPPRRLGALLLASACNVGLWIVIGFFATSEFYRRSVVLSGVPMWDEVLAVQMVTAFNWAVLTPVVFFIAQRLPLRPPHRLRNSLIVLALIPPLAVFRAAFGSAVLNLGEHGAVSLSFVLYSIQVRTHRNIAILAALFFISNLIDAQREGARRERARVSAQTLLARAELEELRTRLQPQFAVRMLRHIGSVLRERPEAADGLVVTLSGILRRSMAGGGDERVRLADELEHLDRCLELCRAGGHYSVDVRYVAGDDVLACRVPELVLQPVIEALVLDLTSGDGGSVEVRCTREEHDTRIDVGWTRVPEGAAMQTSLRIPWEEAHA